MRTGVLLNLKTFWRRSYRQSFAKNVLLLVLIALILAGSIANATTDRCAAIFDSQRAKSELPAPTSEFRFGSLKSNFPHTTNYSHELAQQSEVRNQCNLGTCHLYSWVSMLEHDHISYGRTPIKLSTHYLSAQHLLARSLALLDYRDRTAGERSRINVVKPRLNLGANVFNSRRSIVSYGLIPDEAWTAHRDFEEGSLSMRVSEYVENIVARTRWEIEREPDAKHREKIVARAREQVRSIFRNVIGEIPENFEFNGKRYTPKTFAKTFFPELEKPIFEMNVIREQDGKTFVDNQRSYAETDINFVEKTARELIDKGMNVYLAYHHNVSYVDSSSGIMSISAFHHPSYGSPVNRGQRDYFDFEDGGHAVQIVGYDVDPDTGNVIKWKIKNSWGTKTGTLGYFHMYDDYFREFATSISYFKDAGVPSPTPDGPNAPIQLNLPFN